MGCFTFTWNIEFIDYHCNTISEQVIPKSPSSRR